VFDNGQGELTSNCLKIQHSATADTQSTIFSCTHHYERKLIVQLHRLPFVRQNCGKGIRGRFPGPQYYMAVGKQAI